MVVQLIGVQDLNFDTDDNKHIEGLKLHICYEDAHVKGFKADSKFLSADLCKRLGITVDSLTPYIDGLVDLSTDIKGRIIGITPYRSDK